VSQDCLTQDFFHCHISLAGQLERLGLEPLISRLEVQSHTAVLLPLADSFEFIIFFVS
jgi:hypothetical protein